MHYNKDLGQRLQSKEASEQNDPKIVVYVIPAPKPLNPKSEDSTSDDQACVSLTEVNINSVYIYV
jgi:hypothetical protein